jgi:hypothetical protein
MILVTFLRLSKNVPKTQKCPYCIEDINIKATRCKFCAKDLPPPAASTTEESGGAVNAVDGDEHGMDMDPLISEQNKKEKEVPPPRSVSNGVLNSMGGEYYPKRSN